MTGGTQPLREQRFVFGEVAQTYDLQRPSYPAQFIDSVLAFAGLGPDSVAPVAEIGAGTGKASVALASRGLCLTCIEPSAPMAEVARRHLAQFHNAEVEQVSFEDWQPVAHTYGLLVAAQSWHWVSPEMRYVKAHHALRPHGTLALIWNTTVAHGDERLERDLSVAYGDLIPEAWLLDRTQRLQANNWVITEIEASGLFERAPVARLMEPWHCTYETEGWLQLLSTHSEHRMLDEDTQARLFDRIRAAVDANGGLIEVDYVTVGYLARTEDRPGREDGA